QPGHHRGSGTGFAAVSPRVVPRRQPAGRDPDAFGLLFPELAHPEDDPAFAALGRKTRAGWAARFSGRFPEDVACRLFRIRGPNQLPAHDYGRPTAGFSGRIEYLGWIDQS